jgi:hypothetical protein
MTGNNSSFHPAEESSSAANLLWLFVLALAGLGGSVVIACVAPFVALAVALAGTVRLTVALRAMIVIWLANQFVGFIFFHFPRTPNTVLWGFAIGGTSLLATVVAATVMKRARALPILARVGLAFGLGFTAYESGLFVAALFLGGVETFSPAIIAQVGFSNLVWFIGLVALNELVAMLCKPWLGVTPRLMKLA